MDRVYDTDSAADVLEQIAVERIDNPFTKLHLAEITNEEGWTSKYEPVYGGIPRVWRLVRQDAAGNGLRLSIEELVLSVQGIIAKKDLPPFEDKISSSSTHTQYLRQSITLVGFKTPTFMRALDNVADIHALFGRSVGHQNLQQCGIISTHRQEPTMEISNRYFTPRKHAEQAEGLAFSRDVDPKDILKKAAGNHLMHIDDNVVKYFEQVKVPGTKNIKFVAIKPIKFGVGDIVEAQVSIILVPQREDKFKSTMVLRSLTMLDGTFTQEAAKLRLQLQQPTTDNIATGPSIKRNVGYDDEELGVAKHKFSKMRVEENGEDSDNEVQKWD